jgi:hypothetical protein
MLPSLVCHLTPPSPQLPLPAAVSPERHFQLVAFLSSLVPWREQRCSFSFEERGSANVHRLSPLLQICLHVCLLC